jgi:hypothetical protein
VAENQHPKVHAVNGFSAKLLRVLVGTAIALTIGAHINHLHAFPANWGKYCVSGAEFVATSFFLRLEDTSFFDVSLGVS